MVICAAVLWFGATRNVAAYSTDIGGYERVHLTDGSTLQLNTDTQVTVEFTEQRRRVNLIRGEAFFEVAHDSTRPFDVVVGSATVHAVGTAFAIRRHSSKDVEVVVTEGRVTVNASGSKADDNAGSARTSIPATVSAGEGAIARASRIDVRPIPKPEAARRLAWQEGKINFKGESLIEVISEFNRYNRTRLEIVDPALATLEVGGNFRATDLDAFIHTLQLAFPVRAQTSDGVIRIEARE
jgi:transmembrane sensor